VGVTHRIVAEKNAVMQAASRAATLSLYRQLLKAGANFKNYNFREYTIRRTKEEFRKNKTESDPAALQQLLLKGRENLALVQRQSMISNLFVKDQSILEVKGFVKGTVQKPATY
jgi:hypothetical protein